METKGSTQEPRGGDGPELLSSPVDLCHFNAAGVDGSTTEAAIWAPKDRNEADFRINEELLVCSE